ncbi:hypothetical protein [Nonomuraea sp. WAC 01424]|uniref:hypothetical protein n=1 Tax=Nonomuraea sp. WAC 01424 TaxID=2203200 RepID=UPI0021AD7E7B|nr:hypothetical protein [Nonomuraea sp. WAC 01424]
MRSVGTARQVCGGRPGVPPPSGTGPQAACPAGGRQRAGYGGAARRRLIEERRIAFVHLGRNVRIPEAALEAFISAGLVEPVTARRRSAA